MSASFAVPLWLELVAAALGGIQGALFAAGLAERRIDMLGVIVLGIAVALGGSLLRDILLNRPPVVVWSDWYLPTAAVASVAGMLLAPPLARLGWLIGGLDALVIGVFGAIATSKALALGVGTAGSLLAGVVGGVGGALLRDVLLGRPVAFLHVGSLFAVAAGAGSATLLVLIWFGVPVVVAGIACIAVTGVVRVGALVLGWTFPEQRALFAPRALHDRRSTGA